MGTVRAPFRFTRIDSVDLVAPMSALGEGNSISVEAAAKIKGLNGVEFTMSSSTYSNDDAISVSQCGDTSLVFDTPLKSLNLYNLTDCSVLACGVSGSIHMLNCRNVRLLGFCGQLRISSSNNIEVFVQTASSTALVNSRGIGIGKPLQPVTDKRISEVLQHLNLANPEYFDSCRWKNVKDFDYLPQTSRSENWSFIS
jgi:hypothetical protein